MRKVILWSGTLLIIDRLTRLIACQIPEQPNLPFDLANGVWWYGNPWVLAFRNVQHHYHSPALTDWAAWLVCLGMVIVAITAGRLAEMPTGYHAFAITAMLGVLSNAFDCVVLGMVSDPFTIAHRLEFTMAFNMGDVYITAGAGVYFLLLVWTALKNNPWAEKEVLAA